MEVRKLSSTANYGPEEWWLLLDKVPKVPGSERLARRVAEHRWALQARKNRPARGKFLSGARGASI
jgi:predicted hotdog family 3-hydroxylacyl-ACP dehydratase